MILCLCVLLYSLYPDNKNLHLTGKVITFLESKDILAYSHNFKSLFESEDVFFLVWNYSWV